MLLNVSCLSLDKNNVRYAFLTLIHCSYLGEKLSQDCHKIRGTQQSSARIDTSYLSFAHVPDYLNLIN